MKRTMVLLAFILLALVLAMTRAPLDPSPVPAPRLDPFAAAEASTGTGTASPSGAGVSPADLIASADLMAHVKTLASDAMEGRRTGEPGAERAAIYIAAEFRRLGLVPGGDQGSYLARFRAPLGARAGTGNRLALATAGGAVELVPDRDFRPLAFAAPTRGLLRAPVVFCGYGITAAEPAYDDFAGVDVRGKVALVFRLEPGAGDSLSPFEGTRLTTHADLRTKAKNAFDHGAAGLLVVTGPAAADSLLVFDGEAAAGSGHLPAAQIAREALARALAVEGFDLAAAQSAIDGSYRPHSTPLALAVEMAIAVEPVVADACNVIGILPGSDPDSQRTAIVIGAHYDHLGFGGRGSFAPDRREIHNGADDNASGVAALLEVAAAQSGAPPARTLVFVAFTGEEMGLLGSTRYVEHPAWPLGATRTMVNIDMIGRGPNREIQVAGTGTSPRFPALITAGARAADLRPVINEGGYGPSDQTPFYARNIPVLFLFTAPHADYHRPTDDWQKVDAAYLEAVTRLIAHAVTDLAGAAGPIEFVRADGALPRGGPSSGGEGYGGRGYGPYLGTVPDFSPVDRGIKLAGVKDGSPAAAAGIRGGDVIVGWNGRPVHNMQDYAQALKSQRAGDRVELAILREGKEITVVAVLGERPR
jgi:hypothetical protein